MKHKMIASILVIASLSGCGSTYSEGYEQGYEEGYAKGYTTGYDDAEHDIYDPTYEDGYQTGYGDAQYEFYDSRFAEGYRKGYSDKAAGNECIVAPRGDEYVWLSLVGSDTIYHKYTLPLPECATSKTAEGYISNEEYLDEEDIPCPICFPK